MFFIYFGQELIPKENSINQQNTHYHSLAKHAQFTTLQLQSNKSNNAKEEKHRLNQNPNHIKQKNKKIKMKGSRERERELTNKRSR